MPTCVEAYCSSEIRSPDAKQPGQECSGGAHNVTDIEITRNFNTFTELEPLEFKVPMLVTTSCPAGMARALAKPLFLFGIRVGPDTEGKLTISQIGAL
jgi:hypothetical protein